MASKTTKRISYNNLPSIVVGPFRFDVEWKPCEDIKNPNESTYGNYGSCDRSALIIEVGEDQADQQKLHTILHEIYHASLTDGRRMINEEDMCNHFATLVIQIMRDNKWLKDYL